MRAILKVSFVLLTLAATVVATRAETPRDPPPLWLRYPAISPDGRTIAFIFHGHLFVAPRGGGAATPLTSGPSHETAPIWSPDSKRLAFASDLHGNNDVYVMSAAGGPQLRLTAHSADDIPTAFTPDGSAVLFSSHRTDLASSAKYPAPFLPELYRVPVREGLAPTLLLSTPALGAHYDRQGRRLLFEDVKGVEDPWRKHEAYANAHKLFLFDTRSGRYEPLPGTRGENRNPQWSPDQKSIFYLSEQSGSSNVWQMSLGSQSAGHQVTHFTRNPVRFLSVADNGTLCFGFDGEIYTLAAGERQPVKLSVTISVNDDRPTTEVQHLTSGATEMALSPSGRELAIVVRGDVYVVSTETGATRRITDTPAEERGIAFSPDGRRLAFAAEYGRPWALYEAAINDGDAGFASATAIDIHPLLETDRNDQQPRYSPDGRKVAYLEDRTTLKVLDLATRTTRLVLPASVNYSEDDGDQWFDWSPDSRSLLVNFLDLERWSKKAGLVDASGQKPLVDLTSSGFEAIHPRWSPDGRSMLWISDRYGLHGAGYDAEFNGDVLRMFFTPDGLDQFNLSSTEWNSAHAIAPHPIEGLELDHRLDRTARLTPDSSNVVDAQLSPDGESLFYATRVASGIELWALKPRSKELRRLVLVDAKPGDDAPVILALTCDGKAAYLLAAGRITRVDIESNTVQPVKFDAEKVVDGPAERAWLFDHIWRLQKAKFFDAKMNGIDWAYYGAAYRRFLPFIDNDVDFAEMCSEMVGELNASHLGCKYKRDPIDETASLGAFYDPGYRGAGLKVQEVIAGGPLSDSAIPAGTIITHIDGKPISAGADPSFALNNKAGKRITLDLATPDTGHSRQITVRPVSPGQEQDLLYARWVQNRQADVDRLSGGKVAYVHLKAMNNAAYRDVFNDLFGRDEGKTTLVVDTRYNHGGHMRDDMVTLLSGRKYLHYVPRGRSIGWDPVAPTGKWAGRSVMLINEDNYSDGHLFPWTYQHLKLGKLVGMPIPGSGTNAVHEKQVNPHLTIGIPQGAVEDLHGAIMEHVQIEPDIRVANDPASLQAGQDRQLARAVDAVLRGK